MFDPLRTERFRLPLHLREWNYNSLNLLQMTHFTEVILLDYLHQSTALCSSRSTVEPSCSYLPQSDGYVSSNHSFPLHRTNASINTFLYKVSHNSSVILAEMCCSTHATEMICSSCPMTRINLHFTWQCLGMSLLRCSFQY